MNELNLSPASLTERKSWEAQGFVLPRYDLEAVRQKTVESPE